MQAPDGLWLVHFYGPLEGSTNGINLVNESEFEDKMLEVEMLLHRLYCVYGDDTYVRSRYVQGGFRRAAARTGERPEGSAEDNYSTVMNAARTSSERGLELQSYPDTAEPCVTNHNPIALEPRFHQPECASGRCFVLGHKLLSPQWSPCTLRAPTECRVRWQNGQLSLASSQGRVVSWEGKLDGGHRTIPSKQTSSRRRK